MDDPKEQMIHDAQVLESFLNNEVVQKVFRAYDRLLFEQWKQAPTPALRDELYAKASAFDGLAVALRAVVDSGKRETHELDPSNRPLVL